MSSAKLPRPESPWHIEQGIGAVVAKWEKSRAIKPCFTADESRAERMGTTVPLPSDLHAGLAAALRKRGVGELYAHQAEAFSLLKRGGSGRAVVVATPTASGKSYCFHLPVLDAMATSKEARAIYLYPTKALARDQEAALRELALDAGLSVPAIVYDGDTPGDARRAARERTGIVLTNPDMLHAGILPHHTAWARTFQNLEYVVVDELHTYKGVFGSHVANVLRRLMRVAQFHGSKPKLVGATATIGNPREHAARLFGLEEHHVHAITESGAPQGSRRFFVYNPPVVNAELGIRASYVKQGVKLATDLVRARVPTIVFGHSRNAVEMMLRYLRERLAGEIEPTAIMGYRGGYLPEKRREIERKLREGQILCVVATNALELGIDIGDLDAVVCAGYPGSIAAVWQRFGRAGRRGAESVCVLVTSSAPLDQYLAREPSFLFGAPVEEARIDPENAEILVQHLKCAAFELPFKAQECFGPLGKEDTRAALEFLVRHRVLHEAKGTFHWAEGAYPANHVSLRSVAWDNVVIIDQGSPNGAVLAEIDFRGAHTMVHEQAIYQHDAECWQVERFDYENHKAYVRKVEPDYYTDAMTYVQITVLEEVEHGPLSAAPGPAFRAGHGEVSLVEKVVGYKKIKFHTHENTGYGEVHLPELQMHTTAFWLAIPDAVCGEVAGGRAQAIDGLRGVGVALELVGTLALMCDPRDLGTTLGDAPVDESSGEQMGSSRGGPRPGYDPTLFVYEHVPGGTGLSERLHQNRAELLFRAERLIAGCPCEGGCPSCVGPSDAGPRKATALFLLEKMVASSGEGLARRG